MLINFKSHETQNINTQRVGVEEFINYKWVLIFYENNRSKNKPEFLFLFFFQEKHLDLV